MYRERERKREFSIYWLTPEWLKAGVRSPSLSLGPSSVTCLSMLVRAAGLKPVIGHICVTLGDPLLPWYYIEMLTGK